MLKNLLKLKSTCTIRAGGGNAEAVSRYWNGNTERIATAFIIGADGLIVQCFSSKHWSWHLGVGQKEFKAQGVPYKNLNKTSVGIEVCNWGYLKKKRKVLQLRQRSCT